MSLDGSRKKSDRATKIISKASDLILSAYFSLITEDMACDQRKLIGFKSDYFFLRYADPGVLKNLNRMDFGLFGRSWAPIVSWAVLFVPRANEDAWRGDLPPAAANNMDAEVSFDVVASGYTNGYRPIDKNRPIHGLRTMVQLDELYKDRHVQEGGSLVLQINLIEVPHGNVLDSDHTFDGKVYWHLYSN